MAWGLHVGLVVSGSALFECASTQMLGDRRDGDLSLRKVEFFSLFLLGLILELFLFFFNLIFSPWMSLFIPFYWSRLVVNHHSFLFFLVCRFIHPR